MKVGILLRSVRMRRVTCICAVSEEVFTEARLSQCGITATYYPDAGAVMFERAGHQPHVVLNHMLVDMVADDPQDWDRWLSPSAWGMDYPDTAPPAEPTTTAAPRPMAAKKRRGPGRPKKAEA